MSKDVKSILDEEFENEVENTVDIAEDEEMIDLEELSKEELIDVIQGMNYELNQKDNSEQKLNEFALEREKVRSKYEDKPERQTLESIINCKYFTPIQKSLMEKACAIGESFQILTKYGVDVQNAITISSNLIQNEYNIELAKIQEEKQL